MIPSPVPHGQTARRLDWDLLPPMVRRLVAERCGSPVVRAESQDAGFTPGFASVLTCADGSRHFVKAASRVAQRVFADSYLEEARKVALLPPGTPAASLRWRHVDDAWVVLGFAFVESRQPARPWRPAELNALLDALETTADLLTPAPPGLARTTFAEDHGAMAAYWDELPQRDVGVPGLVEHAAEAGALASRLPEVTEGDTVVHTDVRDDNVLLRPDGSALLCDWNWPCRGAAWIDTVAALLGPRGDGLDVESVLASRRLTCDVPPEHVDVVLALLAGYFLRQGGEFVPRTSPHLRAAQRWQGEVAWDWLGERRGWW